MKLIDWSKKNYLLILIMSVAAGLRIYRADFQSLWLDEVLSMNDANPKLTFKQCYDSVIFWEAFPHLYFMMLKCWLHIFGFTSMAARILSAMIGVFGVYSMYLLGKELYSRNCGLIGASLASVNVFHIFYSQEVRPYGLLFLFTVLSFYRLSILIKKPGYKNAVLYGIFTGLIVNAHFFGLITIFAQCIILLFFLIKSARADRKFFFICSFIGGIVTLLLILPTYEALLQITKIKAFWINKPAPDSFAILFREFFGNSELVMFIIGIIMIYFFTSLFRQKLTEESKHGIIENRMVFSAVILFVWFIISLVIPIAKSYLDVSMILTRYFINILPVLLLVIAIGIDLIRNRIVKAIVIIAIVVFSLLDLFVVKNYYNTPTKTQYKDMAKEIMAKNEKGAKMIAFWSWIFPYFFPQESDYRFEQAQNLDDYVNKLKSGAAPMKAFWYADSNGRPYTLSPAGEAYLNENFIKVEKLEYIDAWANYYVPKNAAKTDLTGNLDLNQFANATFDGLGNMVFYQNTRFISPVIALEKGNYSLIISGNSLPEKPIDGENAHLTVSLSSTKIGDFNLSEKADKKENMIPFSVDTPKKARFSLSFDNDFAIDKRDRNAVIYSIRIQKTP